MSTNKKMGCKPYISVVIAFYKRLDFLGLILDCLDKQSEKRFEVIIAEDDNAQETLDFIKHKKRQVRYPIKHVFQEDLGFRKNRALNRALLIASSDIIAFLDGDCLPHKHFVKQHIKNVREGLSCFGRRVMLGEKISNKMIAHGCRGYLGLITLLMSDSKKVEEAIYLPFNIRMNNRSKGMWGCNWSVYKKDIEKVNGFDEDYIRACVGEDKDIEYRLQLNGIKFKSIKNRAIVFHMYHKENYTQEAYLINQELFTRKCLRNSFWCENGLNK